MLSLIWLRISLIWLTKNKSLCFLEFFQLIILEGTISFKLLFNYFINGLYLACLFHNNIKFSLIFGVLIYRFLNSFFFLYRIDKSVLESAGIAYRAAGVEHSLPQTEIPPVIKAGNVPYPPTEPPLILKYLKGQVIIIN